MPGDPVRLLDQVADQDRPRGPVFDQAQVRKLLRGAVQLWADEFALREVKTLRDQLELFNRRLDRIEARQRVDGALEEGVGEVLSLLRYNVEHRLGMAIESKRKRPAVVAKRKAKRS